MKAERFVERCKVTDRESLEEHLDLGD